EDYGRHQREDRTQHGSTKSLLGARGLTACGDKLVNFICRLRRAARTRHNPVLGHLQRRRAQQQALRATSRRPTAGGFAELGVVPYPYDIRLQGFSELIGVRLEL